MALSAETIAALEEAKIAVQEFYDGLLLENARQVSALQGFDVSVSRLSEGTTEAAADVALDLVNTLLV